MILRLTEMNEDSGGAQTVGQDLGYMGKWQHQQSVLELLVR